MASGQLSPFPSCADGLGFLHSVDCRSASSLLTPTASVGTVSSLTQGGDGDGRARTKTMQTKDIMKSPQPHRFQLIPSSKRKTPEQPSLPTRPSAQWRARTRADLSPDAFGRHDEGEGQDIFSPAASPLVPGLPDNVSLIPPTARPTHDCLKAPRSPRSPLSDGDLRHGTRLENMLSDAIHSPVFTTSRPASNASAFSTQTISASFTLVQDQASKRFSSASGTSHGDFHCQIDEASFLPDEQPISAFGNAGECTDNVGECADDDGATDEMCCFSELLAPTDEAATNCLRETTPLSVAAAEECGDDDALMSGDTSNTTSGTLDSLLSKYNDLPDLPHVPNLPWVIADADGPLTSPESLRRATDGSLPPHASPPPQKPLRDRRTFALRRQAIYAEYGFQIALPASDSDLGSGAGAGAGVGGSVKLLASPSKARAASAYVLSGSTSRSALSLSASSSGRSVADAAPDDGGRGRAGLERLSVQDAILNASRTPLLDTFAGPPTSTPRLAGPRALLAPAGDPPFLAADPTASVPAVAGRAEEKAWAPLRITKRNPVQREAVRISVSVSERRARLSAWEVDAGHHPVLQELIDEVDRALEQWRWILQLRTYL
ncbi:hypothetical protein BD413DRAFT_496044 [Trametes elegans]|nr:hypothetical protein BD413DRAFT_496044 [Trametes elegans]